MFGLCLGDKAAGGSVDSLWAYWHYHHISGKVGEYLQQYRVGRLVDWEGDETEGVDMYEDDPRRPPEQVRLRPLPSLVGIRARDS